MSGIGPTIHLGGVEVPLLAPSAVPLLGCVAAFLLHARACSILAARGRPVPGIQRALFAAGLVLVLVATQTFVDPVGEQSLVSMHMVQHMLLADLSAPLLLAGLRAPLLYFFWPRPVLVAAARTPALRAAWRTISRPPVALGIWLATLYAWHLPVMYEAALANRLVHDAEHLSFALTGVLAWWPLLDPTHHRVEGRIWKAAYVFAARMVGGGLGIALLAWPSQLYGHYGDAATAFGISTLDDQQIAGAIMMSVDALVVIVGVTYFLWKLGAGEEYRDDLPTAARAAAIASAQRQSE